jgi:hypothetical protein
MSVDFYVCSKKAAHRILHTKECEITKYCIKHIQFRLLSALFSDRALIVHGIKDLDELCVSFVGGNESTSTAPEKLDVEFCAKGVAQKFVVSTAFKSNFSVASQVRKILGHFSRRLQMCPHYG